MTASIAWTWPALLTLLSVLQSSAQAQMIPQRTNLIRKTDPSYRSDISRFGLPSSRRRFSFGLSNPFGSFGDPFEIPIFQSRPRFLVWNTEHLRPWSKWSSCRRRSCRKIRFRQCLPKRKCPADFLVETKTCTNATGCDPTAYTATIEKFNDTCGLRPEGIKMKIIGGKDAVPHSWPWQGGLIIGNKKNTVPTCGTTLISDRWAVTAAHCLSVSFWPKEMPLGKPFRPEHINAAPIYAVFGDHHTRRLDVPEQRRQVVAVVVHKKFVLRAGYCINDVALLKLNKPVQMGRAINRACLPPKSLRLPAKTMCTALGWGVVRVSERRTSFLDWFRPPEMIRATVLQEVNLPLVSYDDCLKHFPSYSVTRDRHLCAGQRGKDTCKGDSGGPLMCAVKTADSKTRWFLYGITSFGSQVKCGGSYGVYSRVSEFTDWMKEVQRLL